jgi:hypothetical protein
MNRKEYRALHRELRIHQSVFDSLCDAHKRKLALLLTSRFWDDAQRAGTMPQMLLISKANEGDRDQVASNKLRLALNDWRSNWMPPPCCTISPINDFDFDFKKAVSS